MCIDIHGRHTAQQSFGWTAFALALLRSRIAEGYHFAKIDDANHYFRMIRCLAGGMGKQDRHGVRPRALRYDLTHG